ncbi:MAG TPA: S41 family peptidase [Tepidisphaeraceae bacterium]|nr:S41 family peptidase [Tepidisphaeraceae bacterium]
MNRERAAWLLGFLLLAVAAFRNPTSAQRDSDYRFVRTIVDINRQVATNYVEPVDEAKLEKAAIDGMLNQLDPFTLYVPPARREEFDRMLEGTFKGVGIQLDQLPNGAWEVLTPIDGSPAFRAGVMAGDLILKVNGESIDGLRLEEVIKKIAGEAGTEVRLSLRRVTGQVLDLAMKRQEIVVPTVKGYQRKTDNAWDFYCAPSQKIAYLRVTQFNPTTCDEMRTILADLLKDGMKGLILDLRWNPGGRLDQAVEVVDLFLKNGTIVVTKGRNRPEDIKQASEPGTLPYFPMIVLANEHSASAAEIVAGSLMDNKRAAVLGQRTYGKGSVQELIPLDGNNGELKLTVAYYYLPSGRLVHRKKDATDWGVEPQILVPMNDEIQQKVVEERQRQENFRRPTTNPTTESTTPVAAGPLTDVQLQRAIDTMTLLTIMDNSPKTAAVPSTRPAATEAH